MTPRGLEDAACSSLLELHKSTRMIRSPTSILHVPEVERDDSAVLHCLGSGPNIRVAKPAQDAWNLEPTHGHSRSGASSNLKRRWRQQMERQERPAPASPLPAIVSPAASPKITAAVSLPAAPPRPPPLQLVRLAASMERTAAFRARLLASVASAATTPASSLAIRMHLQRRRLAAATERTRQSRACVRLARRTAAARAQAEAAAVSFRLVAAMRCTRESRMRVVGCRYRASAARLAVAMRRTGESRRGVARQRELLRLRTCDVPAVPLHMLQSKLARVASQGNGAMHCQRSQTVATDGTHHSQVHKSI